MKTVNKKQSLEDAKAYLRLANEYIAQTEWFLETERGSTSHRSVDFMIKSGDMCKLYYKIDEFIKG